MGNGVGAIAAVMIDVEGGIRHGSQDNSGAQVALNWFSAYMEACGGLLLPTGHASATWLEAYRRLCDACVEAGSEFAEVERLLRAYLTRKFTYDFRMEVGAAVLRAESVIARLRGEAATSSEEPHN